MEKTFDDILIEGLLYDNDNIKNKINNYDKEIASDNELINKFKTITGGFEILGIPDSFVISQYGIDVQKNIILYCYKGKSVYRVSLSGVVMVNSNIGKLKCSSVKKINFAKNANLDLFFDLMKKINKKVIITKITANKSGINIYFRDVNKNYIDNLTRNSMDIKYNKLLNKVTIYNKTSFNESALEELTALSSINPIKPTSKPFILKMEPMNSIFTSKCKFAFSPDVVSDKYLVINEDSKLEIVDSDYLDSYKYSIYEYTGDKIRLGMLYKAYKENLEVGPDFIYTCLSGKNMLMEDQIDLDNQFKYVDPNKFLLDDYNTEE